MDYEIVEGEIPTGWKMFEPNCRMAGTPLAGAQMALRFLEERGGKGVIIKRNGRYEMRALIKES